MMHLFAFILGTLPAIAGDMPPLQTEDGLDAAFARAAVQSGRILPLEQILDILRGAAAGEIIEIQLELEEGVLVYEFDLIGPDGHVFEVEVAAATGAVLEIEDGAGDEDGD